MENIRQMNDENFSFFYVKLYRLLRDEDKKFFDEGAYSRFGENAKEIIGKMAKEYTRMGR